MREKKVAEEKIPLNKELSENYAKT